VTSCLLHSPWRLAVRTSTLLVPSQALAACEGHHKHIILTVSMGPCGTAYASLSDFKVRSSKDVPSLFCKSCFRAAFALSYARREEVSSLFPAGVGAAVFRYAPLRAVPSCNALPRKQMQSFMRSAKTSGAKPAEGLRPWRATRGTPIFRAALVQTGLRPPSTSFRVGTPPLALAAPAGVGQGQGVFVSKHSMAIQNRRNHP
jgi:hypothetical protein